MFYAMPLTLENWIALGNNCEKRISQYYFALKEFYW